MEPQWDRANVLAQIERNVKRICDTPAAKSARHLSAPPNPPVASTSAFRCAPAAAAADHNAAATLGTTGCPAQHAQLHT